MTMTPQEALRIFFIALAVMIAVGAILPGVAPGLVNLLNRTVLKEEQTPAGTDAGVEATPRSKR